MKVGILHQEWFPVYVITKTAWDWIDEKSIIDMDEETFQKFKKAHNNFVCAQQELGNLIGESFPESAYDENDEA